MPPTHYILLDEEFKEQVLERLDSLTRAFQELTKIQSSNNAGEDLMDTASAMGYLKVCRRSLFKYREQHGLPHKRLGDGKIYYIKTEIDSFLKKHNGKLP